MATALRVVGGRLGEQVQLLSEQKPGRGYDATKAYALSGSKQSRKEVVAPNTGKRTSDF